MDSASTASFGERVAAALLKEDGSEEENVPVVSPAEALDEPASAHTEFRCPSVLPLVSLCLMPSIISMRSLDQCNIEESKSETAA